VSSSNLTRLGLILASIVIVADQATKWLIIEYVMHPPKNIFLNQYFNLVLVWNNGISFGLFNNDNDINALLISLLASLIVFLLIKWLTKAETKQLSIGLGLVIGGAIGNIIDRIIHGAVIDFIDAHFSIHHWPAFNVADACITIGTILLVVDSLFSKKK